MINGKTTSGFEYTLDPDKLNDYELLEKIGEMEENLFALTNVVNMVLGKEQANKLKDHIRSENGTVPIEKMTAEITEIFNTQLEVKNS